MLNESHQRALLLASLAFGHVPAKRQDSVRQNSNILCVNQADAIMYILCAIINDSVQAIDVLLFEIHLFAC